MSSKNHLRPPGGWPRNRDAWIAAAKKLRLAKAIPEAVRKVLFPSAPTPGGS